MNFFLDFFNISAFSLNSLLIAFVLSFLTVFIWHEILSRSRRKSLEFFFWLVFAISMIFGFVWIVYAEKIITPNLLSFYFNTFAVGQTSNSFFIFALFFSLVITGGIIELGKNTIVRLFGKRFFETVDDVVDLSFGTALGFTAIENLFHFYNLFYLSDTYDTPMIIIKEVISQVFFVLPIHLFCSGIFGYYYGLSLFALNSQRKFWKKLYGFVQFIKGTVISVVIYGLFFYVMKQDYRMGDVASFFGFENFPLNESIFPFISFIFSSLTALYLFEKMGSADFITETKTEKLKREEKESADQHEKKGE